MEGFDMKQRWFTLIELMIVVGIVGILAAVAIPSYREYVIRSRITEGLSLASSAKTAVSEFTQTTGALPTATDITNNRLGTAPTATTNVSSLVIGASGLITINYTVAAGSAVINLTPTLDANTKQITWVCAPASATATYVKYLPASCR
jgi:type IV pilus assembly protein PilA